MKIETFEHYLMYLDLLLDSKEKTVDLKLRALLKDIALQGFKHGLLFGQNRLILD